MRTRLVVFPVTITKNIGLNRRKLGGAGYWNLLRPSTAVFMADLLEVFHKLFDRKEFSSDLHRIPCLAVMPSG